MRTQEQGARLRVRACGSRTQAFALAELALVFAVALAPAPMACGGSAGEATKDGGLGGAESELPAAHSGAGSDTPTTGWCEVSAVLRAKCQRCHAEEPEHGAPFPLVSFEDLTKKQGSGTRCSRVGEVVESGYMPAGFIALEPPVEAMTDQERDTLLGWCAAGAVREPADCGGP